MGLLLFLVGLLALVSGTLKLRQRMRATMGLSAFAVVEVVAGALVVIGSGVGLSRTALAPWAVGLTLAVVFASAADQARRAARLRRSQEMSEAERLQSYVEFRAGQDPDSE
ncbi:MAG: hypothetical protein V3T74_01730 [Gemmatimonadales bacterium]